MKATTETPEAKINNRMAKLFNVAPEDMLDETAANIINPDAAILERFDKRLENLLSKINLPHSGPGGLMGIMCFAGSFLITVENKEIAEKWAKTIETFAKVENIFRARGENFQIYGRV